MWNLKLNSNIMKFFWMLEYIYSKSEDLHFSKILDPNNDRFRIIKWPMCSRKRSTWRITKYFNLLCILWPLWITTGIFIENDFKHFEVVEQRTNGEHCYRSVVKPETQSSWGIREILVLNFWCVKCRFLETDSHMTFKVIVGYSFHFWKWRII